MNIKMLFDRLTTQWFVKIICFVAALFIAFFFRINQMNTKYFAVSVKVENDGLLIPISGYKRQVKIAVRTSAENSSRISEEDISAVVRTAKYTKPGEYSVPIEIELAPDVLLLDPLEVKVSPDTLHMKLDEKSVSFIDIEPSLSGTVAHGYEVESVKLVPATMEVTGPKSLLNELDGVMTDEISLENHAVSFVKKVSVINVSSLLEMQREPSVTVSVSIRPVTMTKTYTGIAVNYTALPAPLRISSAEQFVDFTITGDQLAVENMTVDSYTVQADCSAITTPGEYEVPLLFFVSSSLSVSDKSKEKIKVTVEQVPVEVTEDIPVEPVVIEQ